MLKIKSAIKALEAKADSEAKLAKVAELRNAEVATIDELINAAHEHAIAKKDDKQAAADKLTALREAHINKALAKFVAPKAVKVAGDGTAKEAGTRGGKSADILAFITPLFEGGSTGAEVRKACKEYGGGSWVNFNDYVLLVHSNILCTMWQVDFIEKKIAPRKLTKKKQCAAKQISIDLLQSGGRQPELARLRREVAVTLVKEYGLSLAETARLIGISTSGVAEIVRRVVPTV